MKTLIIPNDHISKVCNLLNQLIGDVTSKNLFTGYGLFHKEKDMFAVWTNNKIYLRAKHELSIKLKGLGCKPFATNELNKRFVLSDYYALTESILKDKNYSNRIEVYYLDDVPQELNPKIFKLAQVVDKIKTEYSIILDDDAVIDRKKLDELSVYEKDKSEWIATGIPFNYNIKGFYSKLISAFINSNSIFSYFSMSFLNENKTINGMFYILRTDILKKYSAFDEIKYWLCDDLALATYLLSKKVKIIQSTIFCNVRNTVPSLKRYILLMKRWLLFSNVYMKNAFSTKFLFIILLPTLLPTILLFFSFYLGLDYLVMVLNLFIGKIALFHIVRLFIYQGNYEENSFKKSLFVFSPQTTELLYELLSEFLLPFMLIYTLLTPPVILWRNKKIRVKDGKIHYEI